MLHRSHARARAPKTTTCTWEWDSTEWLGFALSSHIRAHANGRARTYDAKMQWETRDYARCRSGYDRSIDLHRSSATCSLPAPCTLALTCSVAARQQLASNEASSMIMHVLSLFTIIQWCGRTAPGPGNAAVLSLSTLSSPADQREMLAALFVVVPARYALERGET